MKKIGAIIAGVFIFQIMVSMAASGIDTKEFVMDLLSENVHLGEPGKSERILMYSERTGVPIDEIGKILVQFIADKSLGSYIRVEAISNIGWLRFKEALPVLKDIIRSERNFRSVSVRAIVQIGGEGLIDFAREVVNDHKQYNFFDRFTLYDQMSYYLSDASSRKAENVRESVRQFFLDAANKEMGISCLTVIDRELSKIDEQYKTSYEREEVLKKIGRSKAPDDKQYVSEKLKMLRELSKKKRTHVRIGKKSEK